MKTIRSWMGILGNFAWSKLLPNAIVLVAGIIIIRLVMKLLNAALEKSKLEKAAHTLIKSVVRVVLYALLCLILASGLGIDVTGIVALASVLTLAVSLSLQTALTNVISGFTLLYTNPFDSGDFVEIAGQSGTVTEIGLTYTKLTTGDNKIISIPNSAVTSAEIINYSATGTRRVTISISASYDVPVEKVLEALVEAGTQIPTAFFTPEPYAAVESYGESAINYILRVWCSAEDYWQTQFDGNKLAKAMFDARGIAMSYPHINVHMDQA